MEVKEVVCDYADRFTTALCPASLKTLPPILPDTHQVPRRIQGLENEVWYVYRLRLPLSVSVCERQVLIDSCGELAVSSGCSCGVLAVPKSGLPLWQVKITC